MNWFIIGMIAGFTAASAPSRAADDVGFAAKPSVRPVADKVVITFAMSRPTDVEVAVLGADGRVVRHLAAGMLGGKEPPPAPLRAGLDQEVSWDGKDDSGAAVPREGVRIRVRAGMGVSPDKIVGGDPYAFYSDEMMDSDHSPWGMNGLEVKPDGSVFVLGHSGNLGPPALRRYDADGNYRRTLYPIPAGGNVESMKEWGLNLRPDGTYLPRYKLLVDPSPTTTLLDTNLGMARLMPGPDAGTLTFWSPSSGDGLFEQLIINVDGTINAGRKIHSPGPLVRRPPLGQGPAAPNSHVRNSLLGPVFTTWTPDGGAFYLSGLFSATTLYGTVREVASDGFWRDGRVWKVDARTGEATVFFELPAAEVPLKPSDRNKAFGGAESCSAIHGTAVDKSGNVFVADRLNRRIAVLDPDGRLRRSIPLANADALTVDRRTGALFVTTRVGDYHVRGSVRLLKFADPFKDDKPVVDVEAGRTGHTGVHRCTMVATVESRGGTNVWVTGAQIPVRIWRDDGQGFRLLKDFFQVEGAQRCLGFAQMSADPRTDDVYVLDSHDAVWRVSDWDKPTFRKLPLKTASIALDPRGRYLFARTLADGASSYSRGKVARFHVKDLSPANFGASGTNRATDTFIYEWCFEGNSDKGIAVAPDGSIAVVGEPKDGLRVFAGSEDHVPWDATPVAPLPRFAGGARFDLAGNLYVAMVTGKPPLPPPGLEGDRYAAALGKIVRFAPTGVAAGKLFPRPPAGPDKVYDVPVGAFETICVSRSPRFGVDGWGRIVVPVNVASTVILMDNSGNEILRFGTYGNRDSTGGLPGGTVPTAGVPLGFPNSVDATDDYIYVADMINQRLMRLARTFRVSSTLACP